MVAPLRVGVIGVGYLGRFHAEKYAHLKETDLVGVADLNEAEAREVAGARGAEAYGDYRALLPKVSAVSIAVPTSVHFEVVRDALKAGLLPGAGGKAHQRYGGRGRLPGAPGPGSVAHPHGGALERFNSAMEELKSRAHGPRFIESHRLAFFKERGTDVDAGPGPDDP